MVRRRCQEEDKQQQQQEEEEQEAAEGRSGTDEQERRTFLSLEEAGLVEMSGLSTHERFLCRLTVSPPVIIVWSRCHTTRRGTDCNYLFCAFRRYRL